MANQYSSRSFKQLKAEWALKLRESGFVDQELPSGNLKQHDRSLNSFADRENVLDFFLQLDKFLYDRPDITGITRLVLELYSKGIHLKLITVEVKRDRKTVYNIIRRYRLGKL